MTHASLPAGVHLDVQPIQSPLANLFSQYIHRAPLYVYAIHALPTSSPVASILFIHGYGEHIDRYHALMHYLSNHGVVCWGFDQRGFGKTGLKNDSRWSLGESGGKDV